MFYRIGILLYFAIWGILASVFLETSSALEISSTNCIHLEAVISKPQQCLNKVVNSIIILAPHLRNTHPANVSSVKKYSLFIDTLHFIVPASKKTTPTPQKMNTSSYLIFLRKLLYSKHWFG